MKLLAAIKEMDTSRAFDRMSERIKNCQNKERWEECCNRKLITGAKLKCGCLPLIISNAEEANNNEVSLWGS